MPAVGHLFDILICLINSIDHWSVRVYLIYSDEYYHVHLAYPTLCLKKTGHLKYFQISPTKLDQYQ